MSFANSLRSKEFSLQLLKDKRIIKILTSNRKVLVLTPDRSTRISFSGYACVTLNSASFSKMSLCLVSLLTDAALCNHCILHIRLVTGLQFTREMTDVVGC